MKRVIVTGANGFVGNYFVEALLQIAKTILRYQWHRAPTTRIDKRFCCTTFGK